MDKTPVYGFPTPAYDYGDGVESVAVAEFTSSMSAAAVAVLGAINLVSANLAVEIDNRISADNLISNNISVVSLQVAYLPSANVVSAQLVSVSAVLHNNISTMSNALSNVTSNRGSAVNIISVAADAVSNNLSVETLARQTADGVLAGEINALSVLVNDLSQTVSVLSAVNTRIKAMNTAAQASISVSTCLTVSGVSLPLESGANYFFRFQIPMTMKALTGVTIGVTGPAMTGFVARTIIPTTGTAAAATYAYGTIPDVGGKVSTLSNILSSVTTFAVVEGYANPSAPGSLHCVVGPTANVNTMRVLMGAFGQAWKLS